MTRDLDTDLNFVNRRGFEASGLYPQHVGGGLQLWQDVCSFTCSLCLTHFTALKVRGGDLGIRDNATLWILNCARNSASVALAEGRRPGAREQRD